MPIAILAVGILVLCHIVAPRATRWLFIVPFLGTIFGTFVWAHVGLFSSLEMTKQLMTVNAYLCFVMPSIIMTGVIIAKFDRSV